VRGGPGARQAGSGLRPGGGGEGQESVGLLSLGPEPSLRGIVGARGGAQAGGGAGQRVSFQGAQQGGLLEHPGTGLLEPEADANHQEQGQGQGGLGFEGGEEECGRRRSMDETRAESQFSFQTSDFMAPGS